jgi:hypothetical protein
VAEAVGGTLPSPRALHPVLSPRPASPFPVRFPDARTEIEAAFVLGIDYPVLSDPDGETTCVYKAYALPTLFVIDRTGKFRVASVGYSSAGLEKTERLLSELLAAPR